MLYLVDGSENEEGLTGEHPAHGGNVVGHAPIHGRVEHGEDLGDVLPK